VSKQTASRDEVYSYLESFIPSYLVSDTEIRLEPEIDLDESYYYLHIETPENDLEGTFTLLENLESYDEKKFV